MGLGGFLSCGYEGSKMKLRTLAVGAASVGGEATSRCHDNVNCDSAHLTVYPVDCRDK